MRRRVVHVMRTYGPHGGERQLHRMFSIEAPEWDEHFLYVFRDEGCEDLFSDLSGLRRSDLVSFEVRPSQSPWLEFWRLVLFLPVLQLRFIGFLLRSGCRACIAHGFQAALVVWPALWLVPGLRGAYVHRITKSRGFAKRVFRLIYAPFRIVAGVSDAVTDSLRDLVDGERLQTITNGIGWRQIAGMAQRCRTAGSERLILISVGRLLRHKRHDLLLQMLGEIRQEIANVELWLVGDGETKRSLEILAEGLGVGDSVRWLGRRDDVPCLLGKSDIYVHTSEVEGLSNAVLEAMAAGLPSVVMDAPGVGECHVPGETGLVVERTAAAMSAGVKMLARDLEGRKRMGEAARERIRRHYSMESNRRRYLEVYRELLAG